MNSAQAILRKIAKAHYASRYTVEQALEAAYAAGAEAAKPQIRGRDVQFDTSQYEHLHGIMPRGIRTWHFGFRFANGTELMADWYAVGTHRRQRLPYHQAKSLARAHAVAIGANTVRVYG